MRNHGCSTSNQQVRVGQRRDGHGDSGHVVLDDVTAKEGWILGSARVVSKTCGKQISEIPPEDRCEGTHFP